MHAYKSLRKITDKLTLPKISIRSKILQIHFCTNISQEEAMKYIKWFSTLLALLATLGIIIFFIIPLIGPFGSVGVWSTLKKFWLFVVVILSGSFAIYPKTRYDSWLQRFLAGFTLVSLPLVLLCISLLQCGRFLAGLVVIFLGVVTIFLCFFLKNKAKVWNDRTSKIFKFLLLSPLGAGLLYYGAFLLGIFSKLSKTNLIYEYPMFPFIVHFLSLLVVILGVPAVINGGKATRWCLNLGYAGIILAQLHLLMADFMVLYYGFGGE
jgi:hypothetical protein